MSKKIWLDANTVVSKEKLNEINTLNKKREFPFMIVDSSFDPEKIAKRERKIRSH